MSFLPQPQRGNNSGLLPKQDSIEPVEDFHYKTDLLHFYKAVTRRTAYLQTAVRGLTPDLAKQNRVQKMTAGTKPETLIVADEAVILNTSATKNPRFLVWLLIGYLIEIRVIDKENTGDHSRESSSEEAHLPRRS